MEIQKIQTNKEVFITRDNLWDVKVTEFEDINLDKDFWNYDKIFIECEDNQNFTILKENHNIIQNLKIQHHNQYYILNHQTGKISPFNKIHLEENKTYNYLLWIIPKIKKIIWYNKQNRCNNIKDSFDLMEVYLKLSIKDRIEQIEQWNIQAYTYRHKIKNKVQKILNSFFWTSRSYMQEQPKVHN